jgi:hypothetical protein
MGACHPKGAAGIIHIVIPIGKLKRESNHAEKCPDTGDVERESSHLFQGNSHASHRALVKAQKKWLEWFFNSATQQR